jgi:hypothetical protein
VVAGIVVTRWCRALVRAERIEAIQEEAVSEPAPQTAGATPRSP